jgi:hypothetical protein
MENRNRSDLIRRDTPQTSRSLTAEALARSVAADIGPRPPGVATATLPMPGRLPVSFYSRLVREHIATTLDQAKTDTLVRATGTITLVRHLAGTALGRTMIVLTGEDGNSAHVLFTADVMAQCEPAIRRGSRVTVHGLVTRTTATQPAGIEGFGVQAVSV